MSMLGILRVLDEATLDRLRRDPGGVASFLYPEAAAGAARRSWLQRLFGKQPAAAAPPPDAAPTPEEIDVEKAWHGIHYLLTGDVGPTGSILDFWLDGGEPLGADVGYGPPRAFDAGAVRELSAALDRLDLSELRRRFDPADMDEQGVYPDVWVREGEDALNWLMLLFENMRSRIRDAAERGMCLLVCLE